MGYTHYWYRKRDFATKEWSAIKKDVLDIVRYCGENRIRIAEEYDSRDEPIVSAVAIQFNGCEDEGHETFLVTRVMPDRMDWESDRDEVFSFCKTAHKPYDMAVMLSLLVCVRHSDSIRIESDGDWDGEWTPARRVFKKLFGVEAQCPFNKAAA